MPDVIADVLEREVGVDQALNAAMPGGVRTRTGNRDSGLPNVMPSARGNRSRTDRDERRHHAQKHFTIVAGWAAVLQVIDNRRADDSRQRVGGRITSLALADPQAIIAPVDVIERKRGDFATA